MGLKKGYIFLIFSCLTITAFAQTPKYSNEFMAIGIDARAFGMSRAMVASTNDVAAGYWNPAGLTKITDNIQLGGMYASYFAGLATYNYGGIAYKIDKNSAFSASVIRFAVDDIPNTTQLVDASGNIDYSRITTFSVGDYGVLLSYAKNNPNLKGMSLGGSAKIIYRQAGDFAKAFGFGIDFGIQYEMDKWKFGMLAKDVTSTFNAWSFNTKAFDDVLVATGNEIPQNGLEITLPRLILGAARTHDFSKKMGILVELDVDVTFDGKRNTLISSSPVSVDPHLGVELNYIKKIFFRAGAGQFQKVLNANGTGNSFVFQPNIGLGVKLNNLSIDYALTDIGDVAVGLYSNVVSLKLGINKK